MFDAGHLESLASVLRYRRSHSLLSVSVTADKIHLIQDGPLKIQVGMMTHEGCVYLMDISCLDVILVNRPWGI